MSPSARAAARIPPFLRRPPLCLARNCLTVRQFGPLESIDPNDAMILPHGANPNRMKFSEKDRIYGAAVARRLRAMGIRDKPIAPGSPWQNASAERLIGSMRRELIDHVVVLGEAHLRRMLQCYARYYNEIRTHRSLDKDAPLSRPVQRIGRIMSHALLGGLHHQCVRI